MTTARASAEPRGSSFRAVGRWLTLGIIALEVVIAVGYYAMATVLPRVATELHAPDAYSMAAAGTMITTVLGLVLAGPWADHAGPRKPLLTGFVLVGAGLLTCTVAPTMAWFVAGRLVQGLGNGVLGVALYGLISHLVAERDQPFIFGWLNGAWLVPSLVGPLVAGWIAEHWGWRWVFGAVVALLIVGYGVLLRGMAGRRLRDVEQARTPVRWAWALAGCAGLLALHLGGQEAAWWGIALLAVGLAVAVPAMARLLPRGTLTGAWGTPRLVALRAVLASATGVAEVYVPYHLQNNLGVGLIESGIVLAFSAGGWALGSWLQTRWVGRHTPEEILRRCTLLAPVGPLVILAVVALGIHHWWIAPGFIVTGIGMGAAFPQISTWSLALTPPHRHAQIGGALQIAEAATSAALLAATGAILVHVVSGGALTWALALVAVVCIAGVRLAHMPPRPADTPS